MDDHGGEGRLNMGIWELGVCGEHLKPNQGTDVGEIELPMLRRAYRSENKRKY